MNGLFDRVLESALEEREPEVGVDGIVSRDLKPGEEGNGSQNQPEKNVIF